MQTTDHLDYANLCAENVAAVAFGAACTGDADCTDENNACSTSKTCVCKDGFTMYGGACSKCISHVIMAATCPCNTKPLLLIYHKQE